MKNNPMSSLQKEELKKLFETMQLDVAISHTLSSKYFSKLEEIFHQYDTLKMKKIEGIYNDYFADSFVDIKKFNPKKHYSCGQHLKFKREMDKFLKEE